MAGYMASYVSYAHGVAIIACVPEDRWDENWPIFDAIISSVIFYLPQRPAALGEPLPIYYGQVVEGFLTESGEMQPWEFYGLAGDIVTISMVGIPEDFDDADLEEEVYVDLEDTFLELYGPGGTLVTDDDDSGENWFALIEEYELPEAGRYVIVARAWDIGIGPYELSLTLEVEIPQVEGDGEQDRTIAYGQTRLGELTEDDPHHYWAFEGTEGDVVTISAEGIGNFEDTFLRLWGPDGVMLVENDDAGEGWAALITDYTLPGTGTYQINVLAFAETIGSYELTLTGP
jgi:hypothetical protein